MEQADGYNVERVGEEVANALPRPAARLGSPTWWISGLVQDPGHFEIAVQQLAAAMLDATGLCLFARPPVFGDPQLMVDLINGRYGWGWSVAIAVSVTEVAYQRGLATPPSDFAVRYLGWLQNLTTKRRGAQSHARGNPHGQPMLESEPGRPG